MLGDMTDQVLFGALLWNQYTDWPAPEQVAEILRPYLGIGFRHFVVGFPHPYDAETMERLIRDVVPLLEA